MGLINKYKKRHLLSWRSYRRWYLTNKRNFGIYIFEGFNDEGYFVLTRQN